MKLFKAGLRKLTLVERFLWMGFATAILSLAMFATENHSYLRIGHNYRIFYFGAYFIVFFLGISIMAGIIAILLSNFFSEKMIVRSIAGGWFIYVFLVACLNQEAIVGMVSFKKHINSERLLSVVPFLVLIIFILSLLTKNGVIQWLRILVMSTLVIVVFSYWPNQLDTNNEFSIAENTEHVSGDPVLLIGLDGADWTYIEKLFEKGKLPHLKAMRKNGVWGNLKTIVPTHSPIIWTSIATGRGMVDHGIRGFVSERYPFIPGSYTYLNFPDELGLNRLFQKLPNSHEVVNSQHRLVPAYWNISSDYNQPIIVNNWWASWPAETINGFMVTERIHYRRRMRISSPTSPARVTHPQSLYNIIKELMLSPDKVEYETANRFMNIKKTTFEKMKEKDWKHHNIKTEFPFIYSMFESNRRITLDLIKRSQKKFDPQSDLMVIFRMLDLVGHTAMKYSNLVRNHGDVSEQNVERYEDVYSQSYQAIDHAIGQILKKYKNPNVIVVSDHGFEMYENPSEETVTYGHGDAPPGIFLATGPAFRQGNVKGLSVFDVFPLMASLKNFALSRQLKSSVPVKLFNNSFKSKMNIRYVEKYADYSPETNLSPGKKSDQAMRKQLEGLGYFD